MPFIKFLFARSEPSIDEDLPVYTSPRKQQLPPYSRRQPYGKQLSTILEVDEDADIAEDQCVKADASLAQQRSIYQRMRIPQALLVDASTTLCAYLYFSSLHAQLIMQQRSAISAMASICSQIPRDADDSIFTHCAQGISQLHDSILEPVSVSHRTAILFTIFKALVGYLLLTRAPSAIRPFDFLVVSGAIHCLALYCLFFVPVAAYFHDQPTSMESIWLAICVKFIWIIVFCFACVTMKRAATALYRSRRAAPVQGQACQVQIYIEDTDDETSVAELVSAV